MSTHKKISSNIPNKRKLYYLPIVHTQADMGDQSSIVRDAYVKKMGLQAWRRKKLSIDHYWNELAKTVKNLNLPFPNTKIYQDGLPFSDDGKETALVETLASAGSLNHRLVKQLIDKGAVLVGTESPDLLIEEYNLAIEAFHESASTDPEKLVNNQSEEILKQRDEFIAKRINQTLNPGEVGVLFIGMLHNVIPLLDDDIEVATPIAPVIT